MEIDRKRIQTFTSLEQSKELLALGLNPLTADMAYMSGNSQCITAVGNITDEELQEFYEKDLAIPAWSLAALMEQFPKGTSFISHYRKWSCGFLWNDIDIELSSDTVFGCVVEVVKQLLKEGFIKDW